MKLGDGIPCFWINPIVCRNFQLPSEMQWLCTYQNCRSSEDPTGRVHNRTIRKVAISINFMSLTSRYFQQISNITYQALRTRRQGLPPHERYALVRPVKALVGPISRWTVGCAFSACGRSLLSIKCIPIVHRCSSFLGVLTLFNQLPDHQWP